VVILMGMGKINLSKSTFFILFLAVGFMVGMSFSSVYAGIPWGTSEIADNAITSEKIKQRQVKTGDIKNNAVKSNKIRDGTIQGEDIDASTTLSAAEYEFSTTKTRNLRLLGTEMGPSVSTGVYSRGPSFSFDEISPFTLADAQFIGIPDGANIIGFKCRLRDSSDAHDVVCNLLKTTTGLSTPVAEISTGTLATPGIDIFTASVTPFIFDADSSALRVQYFHEMNCPLFTCLFSFAEITFEVSKSD